MKKLELVNEPAPAPLRPNTPPNLSAIIDYLVANREILHGEQQATALDAQKMIEAVNATRSKINDEMDRLIELLRGTMHERMVSVETVIGGPT
jgi:iron-sulfur cluster repair protein YtfE (RIC family)